MSHAWNRLAAVAVVSFGLLALSLGADEAKPGPKAEGKAVLVDAWAPWCHTCLSMKHYVLTDPSLAPLADRVVLVAIDTDRPENAAFLERHAVSVWPTFFVLDPAKDEVAGYWPGSASAKELRDFVEDSARSVLDDARTAADPAGSAARSLAEAKAAHAAGELERAAKAYERAATEGKTGWPRRSEALLGWLHALYQAKEYAACARVAQAHAGEVEGAAVPADFASFALACAEKLPGGPEQAAARQAAIERLRRITTSPPADSSVDDRADALAILAEGLKDTGDAAGAKKIYRADVTERVGSVHLLGTCRMGNDPATSVIDKYHRTHDVKNLFLCDGSSLVTSGRGQPTMTIQALAFRAADHIGKFAKRNEI